MRKGKIRNRNQRQKSEKYGINYLKWIIKNGKEVSKWIKTS